MSRMLTALRVLDRRPRAPSAPPLVVPESRREADNDRARVEAIEANLANVSALACALVADELLGEVSPTDNSITARVGGKAPIWELPAIDPAPGYRQLARRIVHDSGVADGRSPLLFTALRGATTDAFRVLELAAALGQPGGPVLIVDLERDGPDGATPTRTTPPGGVSEVLSGDLAWSDVICPTSLPGISFVGLGNAEPLESQWSAEVGSVWKRLPATWQNVLVRGGAASRPLTLALAGVCHSTYLLVELGSERTDAISAALKALRAAGANMRGAIALDGHRPRH